MIVRPVGFLVEDDAGEWALGFGRPSGVVAEIDGVPHAAVQVTIWILPDGTSQVGGDRPDGAVRARIVPDGEGWALEETGPPLAAAYEGQGGLVAIMETVPRIELMVDGNFIHGE